MGGGGGVSQHDLQQGGGYPGPHRGGGSPGPHLGVCIPACTEADPPLWTATAAGSVCPWGDGIPACLAAQGFSRPTPERGLQAHTQGGLQAHTWGVSRPTPGGGVSQYALRQTPPLCWQLLLRAVRILLECILYKTAFTPSDCESEIDANFSAMLDDFEVNGTIEKIAKYLLHSDAAFPFAFSLCVGACSLGRRQGGRKRQISPNTSDKGIQ